MPILAPQISTSMIASGGPFLFGISYPNLTLAISNSITSYTLGSVTVIAVNVGAAGSGTATGSIINSLPTTLFGALTSTFIANGMLGVHAVDLAKAISIAVAAGLTSAIALSPVLGVATGTGVGKLLHLGPVPLTAVMTSQFIAFGMLGTKAPFLAKAISEGYIQFLDTLITLQIVAGTPTPVPATAPSIGNLV